MTMIGRVKRKIKRILNSRETNLEVSEGHLGGYIKGGPAPGTWCPDIWNWSVNDLSVESVLDIGCGLGYALEYYNNLGCEVLGVEGSPSALERSRLRQSVVGHDYTDGPYIPPRSFDLVWSAEFVEHVEEEYLGNFLLSFSQARKYIMMTYATPGQSGYHHVNEKTQDYWIEKISSIGFDLEPNLTQIARSLVPIVGKEGKQFREKGLVFVRSRFLGAD